MKKKQLNLNKYLFVTFTNFNKCLVVVGLNTYTYSNPAGDGRKQTIQIYIALNDTKSVN